MLEEKDLEMIAKIVSEANRPVTERLDKLENNITQVRTSLEDKIAETRIALESDIAEIQMTLENETNRNISIIAEGHLDLSRKLDDALKVENEKEMLLIRVTKLENEIRRIKKRIEEIA